MISELEARVMHTLEEWEKACEETNRIRRQYVASGPVEREGRIQFPAKLFDTKAVKEIRIAQERKQQAWDAHQQALDAWRKVRG